MCYDIPFVVGFCLSFCIFVHVLHFISCHHVHCICIRVRLLHPSIFPRCPFCNPALPHAPAHPSCIFLCAGVKRSRNGPRLAKWPWYTTGRPPVKFRSIWRSFDAPTVNRKPPFKQPKTSLTHLHALGHSITIVWAKIAPHLDTPSSLYL